METEERMIELGPVSGALSAVWQIAHRLTVAPINEVPGLVRETEPRFEKIRNWWLQKKPESDHFEYVARIAADFDSFEEKRISMTWKPASPDPRSECPWCAGRIITAGDNDFCVDCFKNFFGSLTRYRERIDWGPEWEANLQTLREWVFEGNERS